MTINLLTVVPSAMVLLADSMLTLRRAGGRQDITTFDSAEKLIALCRDPFPAAALISGAGNVGQRLVSELLMIAGDMLDKQLESEDPDDPNDPVVHETFIREIHRVIDDEWSDALATLRVDASKRQGDWSTQLVKHNQERIGQGLSPIDVIEPRHFKIPEAHDNDSNAFIELPVTKLMIIIASYINDVPMVTQMSWPGADDPIDVTSNRDMRWWGTGSTAISRLVLGFDRQKLQSMARDTKNDRKTTRRAYATEQYANAVREQFMMPVPLESLPLQAAIEFTEFLGRVACGYDRFRVGETTVGGPLDVLVLQSNRRQWISKKKIHSTLGDQARP